MKTLVIVTHPNIGQSVIKKRWIKELSKYPDRFFVHQLHQAYPNDEIDVQAEQRLLEQFDKIVFQFPYYWFNCPYLLKK